MARLLASTRFETSTRKGYVDLYTPHSVELVKLLSKFPKSTWNKPARRWEVPEELAPWVSAWMEDNLGRSAGVPVSSPVEHTVNDKLYPFQVEGVRQILERGYGLLSFEMGLGKTPTAIEALRLAGAKTILVVCPAIVRQIWERELKKWWADAPPVYVAATGKAAIKSPVCGHIVVTSYHLMGHIIHSAAKWDAIILDESHNAKNENCAMGKHCLELGRRHHKALKMCLTGTPVAQEPKDLWAQMEFLRPGAFGHKWAFMQRYVGRIENLYARSGYTWTGVENEEELSARLKHFVSRVTQDEVAHLLPKVTSQTIGALNKESSLLDLMEPLTSPAVVFAFRRAEVHRFAEVLKRAKYRVFTATGEDTADKRHAIIRDASAVTRGILVATMDALGTGVDLTAFPHAFFVELAPKLSTVRQALRRVCRLSSDKPVQMTFLYAKGTNDERRMIQLEKKLNDINKVIEPGGAETNLSSFLSGECMTDEQWNAALSEELDGWDDAEDEYV